MSQAGDTDRARSQLSEVYDGLEEIEEHVHRMADEGGGVVDQNYPAGAPIARNSLLDTSNADD